MLNRLSQVPWLSTDCWLAGPLAGGVRTAGTQGQGRTHRGWEQHGGFAWCVSGEGTHPRGQDERGRALIPGGRGREAFADLPPKACSLRKWLGSSRQGRSPTAETVGRGKARPVLLEQQQLWLSLWPACQQPPGDPETPSLSGPAWQVLCWPQDSVFAWPPLFSFCSL